jgi:cellobiose-specific phosphotransferase system component IIA
MSDPDDHFPVDCMKIDLTVAHNVKDALIQLRLSRHKERISTAVVHSSSIL